MIFNRETTADIQMDIFGTSTLTFECKTKWDTHINIIMRLTLDQLESLARSLYVFVCYPQEFYGTKVNDRFAIEVEACGHAVTITILQPFAAYSFKTGIDELSEFADLLNYAVKELAPPRNVV